MSDVDLALVVECDGKLVRPQTRRNPSFKQIAAMFAARFLGLPHETAKQLTPDEILSRIQIDHYPVPFAIARDLGWAPDQYNHPSNLQPILPADHDKKSAKVDTPQIAKSKRVAAKHQETLARMASRMNAPAETEASDTPAPSRPEGRKLQSRGFAKTAKAKTPRFVPPT